MERVYPFASVPQDSPPTVRGALLAGLKKWLLATHGPAGLDAVLAEVPRADHRTWKRAALVSTSHFPATAIRRFGDAVVKVWGNGDPRCLRDVGAFVAFDDLATYLKVAMKLGSPSFVASRFPKIWSHYFNAGSLTVTARDAKRVLVELMDWQPYGDIAAFGAEGWMRAALVYSGAHHVVVEHAEGPRGSRRYDLGWG